MAETYGGAWTFGATAAMSRAFQEEVEAASSGMQATVDALLPIEADRGSSHRTTGQRTDTKTPERGGGSTKQAERDDVAEEAALLGAGGDDRSASSWLRRRDQRDERDHGAGLLHVRHAGHGGADPQKHGRAGAVAGGHAGDMNGFGMLDPSRPTAKGRGRRAAGVRAKGLWGQRSRRRLQGSGIEAIPTRLPNRTRCDGCT